MTAATPETSDTDPVVYGGTLCRLLLYRTVKGVTVFCPWGDYGHGRYAPHSWGEAGMIPEGADVFLELLVTAKVGRRGV